MAADCSVPPNKSACPALAVPGRGTIAPSTLGVGHMDSWDHTLELESKDQASSDGQGPPPLSPLWSCNQII